MIVWMAATLYHRNFLDTVRLELTLLTGSAMEAEPNSSTEKKTQTPQLFFCETGNR
jgi:hypothetical protein